MTARAHADLMSRFIGARFGAEALRSRRLEEDGSQEDDLPLAVRASDVGEAEAFRWNIRDVLPQAELVLSVGDGGVGKTTFGLSIAGGKACGRRPWGGLEHPPEIGAVLFVSEEDAAPLLRNRLEALANGHGWNRALVLDNVHFIAHGGARLSEPKWQGHLLAEAKRIGASLIVIDPLFEVSGADEDSNSAQRPVIQYCRHLMVQTDATLLMLHHFGKAGEGKRKIDRVRGASAWFSAARAVYALELREGGVQVECLKMNRTARPAPFVLEQTITTDPDNGGIWVTATFRERSVHSADLDQARAWVLKQIREAPERLTTTEVKRAAVGKGIAAPEISSALKGLEEARLIDFLPGPRGAKFWGLATLLTEAGKVVETTLPTLPNPCPNDSEGDSAPCPSLKGGQGTVR